ncbi:MAG TPA: efflux RND transporter permease subunit, partial [Bacteroidales bacterium]|nr:efflux RND transporter permease subunit [Bacteroidales bacterium]
KAKSEMRKALSKFTGAVFSMNTFLTERIRETFSGYTAPIVINIFGNNLKDLDHIAQRVAQVLHKVPHSDNIRVQSPTGMPEVMIKLKKAQLQRWGFDPVNVLNDISTAYSGTKTGQIYQGDRDFNVAVILPKKIRNSVSDIKDLPLESPTGKYIHLGQIANVYETSGRYSILHNGARRVQTVSCNVTNRDVKHFMQNARKMIHSDIHLPAGTYIVFSGSGVAQAKSRNELLLHSLLAGILIIMLLSVVTKHYNNLLLILLNLPFALVGGVLAVFFTGGYMTIGSLVGFVTLFGITLRNSIMLISHFDHLVKQEGYSWNLETAIKGASERLTPILMTALVTAFGLLPLALGSGSAGREIEGPMAIVILGGLATSTALNLLILPTLALRFGKFDKLSPGEE